MHRRRYLVAAAGVAGLAGCTAGDGGEDSGATSTPTTTATASPTPTPRPPSFEVIAFDVPSQVKTGESFQVSVTVRNHGEVPGVFETRLDGRFGDKRENVGTISIPVPAEGRETWKSARVSYETTGSVEYMLPEYGLTATQEIVPASTKPEVLFANLVSDWQYYGDAQENAIESANAGEYIYIAYRYRYYLHEGTIKAFGQVAVFNENDDREAIKTNEDKQVYEGSGYSPFEHAAVFDTRGWGRGTYEARVAVRDEVTGKVSNTVTTSFELT